jgi:hypothetical protein
MVDATHHLYFFDETLLSILLTVCCLLGKCFHSILHSILQFLSQIDRSKVTFANFFNRFELFMKTSLIQFSFENLSPTLKIRFICQWIHTRFLSPFKGNLKFLFGKWKFEIEIKFDGSTANIRQTNLNQCMFIDFNLHSIGHPFDFPPSVELPTVVRFSDAK